MINKLFQRKYWTCSSLQFNLVYILLFNILQVPAEGMAVKLNQLFIKNNTPKEITIQIPNLTESYNQFTIPAHNLCQINRQIMFQPFVEESNNFVIMVRNSTISNPIVIDSFGLLALAQDSAIKANYQGNVKYYSLLGFCGNKLEQYKFLNVIPHSIESEPPTFLLANCNDKTNFVYLINDKYVRVKNRIKYIDFTKVKPCAIAP